MGCIPCHPQLPAAMSVPSTATPNVPQDTLCGAGNPLPMGPRPWGRLLRAKPAVGAARPRCRPPFSPLWPSPASGNHPLGSGGAAAPPLGWRPPGCYGRASPSRRALPTGGGRCCTRCCCHAAAQTAGRGHKQRLLLPGTQAPNVGHRAINAAAGPQAPQVVFVGCVCLFIELRCPKTGGKVGWGCCSTSNRQRLSTKESFQPQRGHGAAATYGQRGKR